MDAALAVSAFDAIILATGLGFVVGGFDFQVAIAHAQRAMMISVCELVEGEVRHAATFCFKDTHVGEFDGFLHGWVAIVFAQPFGTGMIFGSGRGLGILGIDPERHLLQFSDCFGWHHADDFFQLCLEEGKCLGESAGIDFFAHVDRPASDALVVVRFCVRRCVGALLRCLPDDGFGFLEPFGPLKFWGLGGIVACEVGGESGCGFCVFEFRVPEDLKAKGCEAGIIVEQFRAGVDMVVIVIVLAVVVEPALNTLGEVFVMIHACVLALPQAGFHSGIVGGFDSLIEGGIHV